MQHRHINIGKRPGLDEVIQSLRDSGRNDIIGKIEDIVGVLPAQRSQQKNKPVESRKFRSAYIYINNTKSSTSEQTQLLHEFIASAKKLHSKKIDSVFENMEMVPIALPGYVVVLAIRVSRNDYLKSPLVKVIENQQVIRVYLRKPRSDTQHLAVAKTEEFKQSRTVTKITETKHVPRSH